MANHNIDIDDFAYTEEIEEIEEIEEQDMRRKRYIRDFVNPFEFYNDREFKRRFRFTKEIVGSRILPKIIHGLEKNNRRGLPVAPEIQLLIALRFYATGCFQTVCGDLAFVAQSSVSRCVKRVTFLLAALMGEVIKFPSTPEQKAGNREVFRNIGNTGNLPGIPGVDGALDCTHITLSHTKFQNMQEIYRNRKGYFSLNVQAIVGPHLEFLDLVPEWPGSEHDSRIFQNSRVYMRYRRGELDGLLLGDAGYSSYPFLLTPFRNPDNRAKERYNFIHSRTRMVVERTFGVWKRRFPCLKKGLGNKLETTIAIVVTCAVLHNLAITYDSVLPGDEEGPDEDDAAEPEEEPNNQEIPCHGGQAEGLAVRSALVTRLFTHNGCGV